MVLNPGYKTFPEYLGSWPVMLLIELILTNSKLCVIPREGNGLSSLNVGVRVLVRQRCFWLSRALHILADLG